MVALDLIPKVYEFERLRKFYPELDQYAEDHQLPVSARFSDLSVCKWIVKKNDNTGMSREEIAAELAKVGL